jgi:hypothetical protein
MDFQVLYKNWIDENGGVKSAIDNTTSTELMRESVSIKVLVDNKSAHLYYDMNPVLLSLGSDQDTGKQIGVNLNVLPYQTKFHLFRNIYKLLERRIIPELSQPHDTWKNWPINEQTLAEIYKIPSRASINKYDRRFMRDIEAIDWGSAIKLSTYYEKNSLLLNRKKQMTLAKLLKMSL